MAYQSGRPGCKAQIKSIIDSVEDVMFSQAQNVQRQYVSCFPDDVVEEVEINSGFISKQMEFLSDSTKILNDIVFDIGFVGAAKCFFSAAGIEIENGRSERVSEGIEVLVTADGKANVYITSTDADEYRMLYTDDNEYFEYMSAGGVIQLQRELAFALLKYNHVPKQNIILIVNSEFKYSSTDFSSAGKNYITNGVESVFDEIGLQGTGKSIAVYPYDFFFKQLRENLPVDYFIGRMEKVFEQRSLVLNNVGRLLYTNAEELIAEFAYASNNYVGTEYRNSIIEKLDDYYKGLPKPRCAVKPPYKNDEYTDMFTHIADSASSNLYRLEVPEICKPLLTSEWLYNNVGDVDGFDNTFICFGYLKLVEILLSQILIDCYKGHLISINKNNSITISSGCESKLMLGNMIRFITQNPASNLYSSPYLSKVTNAISCWTKEIRNGYFHKHTVDRLTVNTIRNRTFEVVYMLLGTIPK